MSIVGLDDWTIGRLDDWTIGQQTLYLGNAITPASLDGYTADARCASVASRLESARQRERLCKA